MKTTLLPLLLLASCAQAHSTIDAGNVTLEWHTDTNERLQVDGDTTLTVTLKVAGKPLNAAQCRCTLLLYQGAVSPRVRPTVLKTQIDEGGNLNTVITVSKAGAYALVVDGKPLKPNDFAPFRTVISLIALDDVYNGAKP
ncbi:MAG: hypothetical protein Q4C89_07925 [Deinococcus sp.]|uniref:hypothetical protein n=1 Tax=Deinococcus sp. TaxID=47478 RepID=UPI0026DB7516|nr:hypothetical protein [Deinococcus sp.]MDO4245933.1 hypothetical protein [Deinococcus sp.]